MAVVYNKDRFGNPLTADEMLKRFKRKVEKEHILTDLQKYEYFVPKATKRREKRAQHERLLRKASK